MQREIQARQPLGGGTGRIGEEAGLFNQRPRDEKALLQPLYWRKEMDEVGSQLLIALVHDMPHVDRNDVINILKQCPRLQFLASFSVRFRNVLQSY